MGLVHKREEYFKREIGIELEDKLVKNMQQVKLSFREVNEFIQGFHQEYLEFGAQNKKEKIDIVRIQFKYEKYSVTKSEQCMIT